MSIATAHVIVGIAVLRALCRTVLLHFTGTAARALLRDAKRHRHLENMSTTVGRSHFAGARVDSSVRAASGTSDAPTRLPASSCCLAVLTAGPNLRRDAAAAAIRKNKREMEFSREENCWLHIFTYLLMGL